MFSDSNENRYQSLLQPIKDIASNWDIDIAESLTEYLDELDQLRISMDGGKTNLNFAEAALLIQGSTAVYSKKVEYLYSLVLKSLDFISSKKTNNGKSTKQLTNNKSMDDEDFLLFETDASFLLLDHVIDEGKNINLKTKSTTNHLRMSRNSRESINSVSTETSRVSMSLMHSILNDNQGSSSLKLSTPIIDGSGALLLCGTLPSMMNNSRNSNTRNSFLSNTKSSPIPQPIDVSNVQYDQHDDYFDDNDNDCGDIDDQNAQWNTEIDNNDQQINNVGLDPNNNCIIKLIDHNECTPKKIVTTSSRFIPSKQVVFRDMFKQLDPHQIIPGSKEVRKGKTYKIPISLLKPQEKQSRLDLLYYKDSSHDNSTLSLLQSNTLPSKGLFDQNLMPILKLKRKLIRQARLAAINSSEEMLNKSNNMEINPINSTTRYQNLDSNLISNVNDTSTRVEQLWMADYGDNNNEGYDDIDDDHDMIDHATGEYDHEPISIPNQFEDNQYGGDIDYVYDEEEELARRLQNVLNEDLNKSNRNSYESICQQYINDFNRGADLFARETLLSRRVSDWTQRLEPILQRQEEEPQFDIHAYCDRVIVEVDLVTTQKNHKHIQNEHVVVNNMNCDTTTNYINIGFNDIVHGKNSVEVCRIFLACLQLTNQGSISIIPNETIHKVKKNQAILINNDDTFDDKVDPFSIHLNNNNKKNNQTIFNFSQENLMVPLNNDVENMKISNELENKDPIKMKKTIKKHKVKFDSDTKMTSICNNIAEIII